MTAYTHTLTAIVPIDDVGQARALALYYDPDPASDGGFHTRYSADGSEPATHSVAHTVCTDTLIQALTAAQSGEPDAGLLDAMGMDAEALQGLLDGWTIAVDANPKDVIAGAGIQPVETKT